ncbi:hypothetical protein ACFWY9_10245 [Amycolatopsis sp. NPDC059027]|uniref:hypothetical protein n=1 Tax=Amycolatopsis sp. NPDC059027 TaxID=3346709 RepID=UPI00366F3852
MNQPLPSDWQEWVTEGTRLAALPPLRRSEQVRRGSEDPKFALGDFLLTIPAKFVEPLAEALGLDAAQFRIYREVASKVPPDRRVAASWTVHRDLRDRTDLLRDGLTVRQAAERAGKLPIDSKADQRLSVDQRAAKVRSFLSDPDVYAVIDREMAESRADRQVRHRARLVHVELAKRQRELENELRALREAKSPFEATVKAELDLNKAAQLVYAVGKTMHDLPSPERLVVVLDELRSEIDAVLKPRVEKSNEAPFVVDGQVRQDRPARADL